MRKLLLIEDDAGIAAMLPAALRSLGYDVLVARDCRSAAEIAASDADDIDVTLCDVLLPDGSGPQAVESVRRYCPRALIVFMSGSPVDVLEERGLLSLEVLDELDALYLAKPFLPRDAHRLIDRALAARACAALPAQVGIPAGRGHVAFPY